MTLRERWHQVKKWLREARDRVWAANKARKEADPGSAARKKAAAQQRRREAIRDNLAAREAKLQKRIEARQAQTGQLDPDGDGLVSIDGYLVTVDIGRDLLECRRLNLIPQSNVVISGYRTPAYSESICYARCGAPTCSGTCAGRYSRHAQLGREGAVDINPAVLTQVKAALAKIGSGLHNSIGASDPNHLSYYGN